MQQADTVVIGGGIVGVAVAREILKRYPKKTVMLLEKESDVAVHQTGHNSGVIHAGVYYRPGSLKASLCRKGAEQTIALCQKYDLPFDRCGKLIVATNSNEVEGLDSIRRSSEANGLEPEFISQKDIPAYEANIQGVEALLIRQTGITDYRRITHCLLQEFIDAGGIVSKGQQVKHIDESSRNVVIRCQENIFSCQNVISCAGLYADKVAKLMGLSLNMQIVPFKGEYYRLPDKFNSMFSRLIYPVPEPDMPFLGIHITKMIDGSVTVGPNAIMALGREQYSWSGVNVHEVVDMLGFKGTWKLMKNNLRAGLSESMNAMFKLAYLQHVRKYCPQIGYFDLQDYHCGIRAQAVRDNGALVEDFEFCTTKRSLHVLNAPSPAATSAMPIAEYIVGRMESDRYFELA